MLYGEEAVQVGLTDQVGGLADGLACLHRQIRERKTPEIREKPRVLNRPSKEKNYTQK